MTPEEIERWNKDGCVERSVHEVARMNGGTMTKEEFVERFGVKLDDSAYFDTLRDLSIPFRAKTTDYSEISRALNVEGRRVLVFSEVHLDRGNTTPNKHCSVLLKIDDAGFTVWTPLQNGGEEQKEMLRDEWAEKQCSGAILG